jgi:hypothetical protein
MSDNTCFLGLAGILLSHAQKVIARLFTLLVVLLSFEHGSGQEAQIVPETQYLLQKTTL